MKTDTIDQQPELIAAHIQIERLDNQVKAMGQENDLLQQENARLRARARQLEAAIMAAFEAEGRAAVAAALEGLWGMCHG